MVILLSLYCELNYIPHNCIILTEYVVFMVAMVTINTYGVATEV